MNEEGQGNAESEAEQVKRFVHAVVQSAREKSADAQKYFESISKMAVDFNAPPQYQELGKVLRDYMAGKHPDLSALTGEFAEILKDELGE
ncbi:MAG: hypothetical protein Fur002_22970 [Anaerolineales bacterium]